MNVLFIIDRIELKYFEFNDLVTNFWLIKGLLEKGANVDIATIDNLNLTNGKACVNRRKSFLQNNNIFYEKELSLKEIETYDLVMFRPDPPVDLDYINATYIFDFVDTNKTKIINSPQAIRNFNEKLHAVKFSHLMPENIVTCSKKDIIDFLNKHEHIVLKPLNACFGSGVMLLKKGENNTNVIIDALTQKETKMIMVQKYIEKAKFGDKRVLFLNGKVLDECIQKLPGENDFKFNDHSDKSFIHTTLSKEEKENFTPLAEELNKMGLSMVGLDVIDGKIIEINVTSPCYFIREINQHLNINFEKTLIDYLMTFDTPSPTLTLS